MAKGRQMMRVKTEKGMRHQVAWNAVAAVLVMVGVLRASESSNQKAIDQVVAKAAGKLDRTEFPAEGSRRAVKNIAVLPITGDESGYAWLALKSTIANSSYKLFSREEAELTRIHREILANSKEKRGDVMDANSIQQFGQIQGVDAVIYGQLWQPQGGPTKLILFLAHVETGELLWSSGPLTAPTGEKVIAPAPGPEVQKAMDRAINTIAKRLNATSFPAEGARRAVENIAVLNLVGDPGGYARDGLKAAVANSHYKAFTRSEAELRSIQSEILANQSQSKDGLLDADSVQRFGKVQGVDAVLYGRVWRQNKDLQNNRGRVKLTVYLAHVETGELLWSSGPVENEAYTDWTTMVERYWIYPAVVVGGLIVLVIVGNVIRKATRPR